MIRGPNPHATYRNAAAEDLLAAHDPATCSACARERQATEVADRQTALAALQSERLTRLVRLLAEVEDTAADAFADTVGIYMELDLYDAALRSLDYIRAAAALSRDRALAIRPVYRAAERGD